MLAHLLPLAIGAACSPALLAVTIELLAVGPDGARRRAGCYLAAALPVVALGTLGVFIAPSLLARGFVGDDRVIDVVDVVLGVLLVALGCWLVARRRRPAAASPRSPSGRGELVGLGVVMMVTDLSTLVLFIAGLREVVVADVDETGEVIGVAVLVVGALVPVLGPLGIDIVAPGPSRRVLDPAQRLVAHHGTTIAAVVSLVFGAYLIGRGARAW